MEGMSGRGGKRPYLATAPPRVRDELATASDQHGGMKTRILTLAVVVAAVVLGACAYPVYQDSSPYGAPRAYYSGYPRPYWQPAWAPRRPYHRHWYR